MNQLPKFNTEEQLILFAVQEANAGKSLSIEYRHDDWCPKLRGKDCRCEPELYAQEIGGGYAKK